MGIGRGRGMAAPLSIEEAVPLPLPLPPTVVGGLAVASSSIPFIPAGKGRGRGRGRAGPDIGGGERGTSGIEGRGGVGGRFDGGEEAHDWTTGEEKEAVLRGMAGDGSEEGWVQGRSWRKPWRRRTDPQAGTEGQWAEVEEEPPRKRERREEKQGRSRRGGMDGRTEEVEEGEVEGLEWMREEADAWTRPWLASFL
jgi:hypothetical protein